MPAKNLSFSYTGKKYLKVESFVLKCLRCLIISRISVRAEKLQKNTRR